MNFRQAIVVATHPEDHSVDLVMLDDGSRVVGAQVLTPNDSGRTGTFHMAPVTREGDKWDITKRTDQDQIAIVGFMGRNPMVVGFLYPQVNQMALKSDKTFYFRHHSDLEVRVNERGAFSINHPGGLSLSVGTNGGGAAEPDGHFDEAAYQRNRNAGTMPDLTLSIRGSDAGETAFSLYVSQDGEVTVSSNRNINISSALKTTLVAGGDFTIRAPKVVLDTPLVETTGDIEPEGDVLTGLGVSLNFHVNTDVMAGSDNTGPPATS